MLERRSKSNFFLINVDENKGAFDLTGQPVETVNSFKCLRTFIGDKLTFRENVENWLQERQSEKVFNQATKGVWSQTECSISLIEVFHSSV